MIRDVQLGGTTSIDFYFDASGFPCENWILFVSIFRRLVVLGSIVPAQVATALMAIPYPYKLRYSPYFLELIRLVTFA